MLPLAAGEQLVLEALPRGADKAEQERRVLVVKICCLRPGPERPRGIAREIETSARIRPLRLPVVEVKVVDAVAGSEVVAAGDLRHIGAEGNGALVAIGRAPRGRVPERSKAGPEFRHAGVAGIVAALVVGARDP